MRERIIESAKKLFMTKGYSDTTVNDILSEADVAKGTFYHHFQSKEDLLSDVAERIKEGYLGHLRAIADDCSLSATEKFTAMEELLFSLPETSWINQELNKESVDPALLYNVLRQSVIQALPLYEGMTREGVADGSIKTPYPEIAALLLLLVHIASLHIGAEKADEMKHFAEAILQHR